MSTQALQIMPEDSQKIERTLLDGDLGQLTPDQRLSYYKGVCESLGLNPLTKPFAYIRLNGKLVLYALKDCTEQLRAIHGVSLTIPVREVLDGVYVVTARAIRKDGRQDESTGAVPIEGLKGENKANAMMKAETKAKRRVTLSICGMGMLDETEVEVIPGAVYPAPDDARGSDEAAQGVARSKIRQLSAPKQSESNPEPEKPKRGEKAPLDVEMLNAFKELKRALREFSPDDSVYYAVLGQFGYEKSNQIPSKAEGRRVYKGVGEALNSLKQTRRMREDLIAYRLVFASENREADYWAICEGYDSESINDISPAKIPDLLDKLRTAKDQL